MLSKTGICGLLAFLLLVLAWSCSDAPRPSNKKQDSRSAARPEVALPDLQLLSPEDSAAAIELPAGYKAEVVVAEPQVEEPVLLAWDGNGRMYVAEMRTFMQDADGNGQLEPSSRILRFEDRDGDGTYETRTIFADKLVLPRALLPLDHRLLIMETNSRNIICLADEDQDGVAEKREVVIENPESDRRNLEHQDANLLWNIDNWIYSCQGGNRHRLDADGTWRREPLLVEQNQWGLTQDDTGQLYFADNTRPARDFQQHWVYWNLLQNDLVSSEERQLAGPNLEPDFFEVWPLVASDDAEGAATELREDGTLRRFTCACGQHIYRGDALPALNGNIFICEPVGRLVRRGVIEENTGRKFIRNPHKKSEFLRSRDYFFRPVHLDTGPDGHLYIVDMNRGIIQESAWLVEGSGIRQVIDEKGLDRARRRGRILRVVSTEHGQQKARPRMLDQKSDALLPLLGHGNGWWRDTAQRLLVLRRDKSVVSGLEAMVSSSKNPLGRLHALWTLEGLGAINKKTIITAMKDKDWRVRAAAIRISEPWLDAGDVDIFKSLAQLTRDSHGKVLQQAVLSLATGQKKQAWPLASEFIRQNWNYDLVRMAAITGFHRRPLAVFDEMKSLAFFKKSPNAVPARPAQQAQNQWLYSLRYEFAAQRPVAKYRDLDAAGEKKLHRGSAGFQRNCVMCHGANAAGATHNGRKIGADLSNSDRVLGNPEGLVRILLHGLRGEINGEEIGVMIPYAGQDDRFIADILSALRWSQRRSMITAEFVGRVRQKHKNRRTSWTLEELGHAAASRFLPQDGFAFTSAPKQINDLPRLHDNNLITSCQLSAQQKAGDSFEIAWTKPHEISYLVLDSGDSKDTFARGFKVEAALRDGVWQEVGSIDAGKSLVQEVALRPVAATRLRISLTSGSPHRWVIHEVSLFGLPAN